MKERNANSDQRDQTGVSAPKFMRNYEVEWVKERILADILLLLAAGRFSSNEDREAVEQCVRVLRDIYIYGEQD